MMKKSFFAAALALFLIFTTMISGSAAKTGEYHWYFKKNDSHTQPPIPSEFSFIEDLDGIFIDHKHGDSEKERVIYLTFDAGYENGNVEKVLDALHEAGVPGAFFVLSHFVSACPDLVLRMEEEGHLICNHTAHHKNLSFASRSEIESEIKGLEDAVREVTGHEVARFFRPPEGSFSRPMLETVHELGYHTVFWSFAYADWDNAKQPDPKVALDKILAHLHNGAVILLHPTSATNAQILPQLICEAKKEGYRFGTLSELCEKG